MEVVWFVNSVCSIVCCIFRPMNGWLAQYFLAEILFIFLAFCCFPLVLQVCASFWCKKGKMETPYIQPLIHTQTLVNLCSGFYQKPLMGVLAIFSTGTYAGIGMVCRVWKCYEKCHKKIKIKKMFSKLKKNILAILR